MSGNFSGGSFSGAVGGFSVDGGSPTPPVIVTPHESGVRKRYRVRRADFSSQENYELALKAALADARFALAPAPVEVPIVARTTKPKLVVTDTAIKVSASDLAALQRASEMEEMELMELFINVIEMDD